MRKKVALIVVLFSVVLLINVFSQGNIENVMMYSPSTHGGAGL